MNGSGLEFNRRAVRPIQCLREGWRLIKAEYWLFLGITLLGMLLAMFGPFGILLGPMMCGIYMCLLGRMYGQPASMNLLFRGFNYFVPSFIATLLMMVPMIIIMVPFQIGFMIALFQIMPQPGQAGAPPEFPALFFAVIGLFSLAIMVISTALQVLFFFVYPLIVDRQLTGLEAVKVSFKAAFANFGGILGLMILTMVMSMIGMLACYVGAFFFIPIHFAAIAVAYRQVFPARVAFDDRASEEEGEPGPPAAETPETTDFQERPRRDQIQ